MINQIKTNPILRNLTSFGSATLLNAVLAFIANIITRNLLGPEQYGYWLTVSLIFTFAPLLQLGTLNAMNREVPYYIARKNMKKVQEIRESVFSFMYTIPLYSIVLFLGISIVLFFTDIKYEYKIGLLFAIFIAGLTFLSGYVEMYYKSNQNFGRASWLISVKSISQSLLTIGFVYFWGYIGLYFGMLIALFLEVFLVKGILPKAKKTQPFSEYKELIKIGFPILFVGILWTVMIATDRLVISLFMTAEELGYYGVGLFVFSTMMLFPQVIGQVYYPKIVELVSIEKIAEIKRLFWSINKKLAVLMGFIVGVGYFLMPYFIRWFLPEYIQGTAAAQILLIGTYPLTLVGVAANYFNSTKNQKVYMMIQLFTIFLNILLSILLLYIRDSINSVAIATSISFIVYFILMNVFFLKKINQSEE